MAGLLDKIKAESTKVAKSQNKKFYTRDGDMKQIRFLQDLDDGYTIKYHEKYENGNMTVTPCLEEFDMDCPYCNDASFKDVTMYVWSIWDYDAEEVKLFMYKYTSKTPLPHIFEHFKINGTLIDRDYVIKQIGERTNKSFMIMAQQPSKFRNTKVKAYSQQAVWNMIKKADANIKDDEEILDNEELEVMKTDYDDMSVVELYKECIKREIKIAKKLDRSDYLKALLDDDKKVDEWSDDDTDEWEDSEDEWEDE